MTTGATLLIGASSADRRWDAVDWHAAERSVRRLQMRIAKATREGRWGKVQALQRLQTDSFAAKLLAVRRVVRNRGRRTAGVDGVIRTTSRQKWNAARSLRRRGHGRRPLRFGSRSRDGEALAHCCARRRPSPAGEGRVHRLAHGGGLLEVSPQGCGGARGRSQERERAAAGPHPRLGAAAFREAQRARGGWQGQPEPGRLAPSRPSAGQAGARPQPLGGA